MVRAFGDTIVDLGRDFSDFTDTAAAMMQMDIMLCVDSAVAHLAGALGRPVWVMLPFYGHWIWTAGRSDSFWYPTMKLFQQTSPGAWDEVIQRVVTAIGEEVARRKTA